ncbi:MAG TPA: ABC transporter permease [Thermoanaerobaculia bacterium]|nr:ABC transporter permease [Thermoanaerobaculia bacterium]
MSTIAQDLRHGLRLLAKRPGFTAVAVLTLGLGIGAATAIFSVANAVLLRPLPFKEPGRLVVVETTSPLFSKESAFPLSAPDVLDFRGQNQVFEDLGAFKNRSYDLSGNGEPQRVLGARIAAQAFAILGVPPLLGRTFTAQEDRPGRALAVLSHGLWQRRFAGDHRIVGKIVDLDRQPYVVIGVMPAGFEFPLTGMHFAQPAELWVPLAFTPKELAARGDDFDYGVVARLKAGVSLAAANADAALVAHRVQETYPVPRTVRDQIHLGAAVTPLQEHVTRGVRRLLVLLLGAVGLLLLIACANVANVLLTRVAERQRELAVRAALGAGRLRVLRQLLAESALLAAAGGVLGLLLAFGGVRGLAALAPEGFLPGQEIGVDARALAFALSAAGLSALLFGTLPALVAVRTDLHETLKEGGRSASVGRRQRMLRGAFGVSQVALALVLVTGAGLLIRSLVRAREADPGFRPENVLAFALSLPAAQYPQASQTITFYERLLARLAATPGVAAAGAGSDLPTQSAWTRLYIVDGKPAASGAAQPHDAHTLVLGGYLDALGIRLIRGRSFSRDEMEGKAHVVLISDSIACRYWAGEDPVGKRLAWGSAPAADTAWLTVVGVVTDVKDGALDLAPHDHTFEPYRQSCGGANEFLCGSLDVVLRTRVEPASLAAAVRREVGALDPLLPVAGLRTMERIVSGSIAPRRFHTFLLGLFAAAALLLAALGVYGVLAYNVTQQTHDIGVRMALGARRGDVLRMVLGHGMSLALWGAGLGFCAALALTRLLASFLYGVAATDPPTFAGVAVLLAAVALLACYVPAHRATRVEPTVALRHE